MARHHWSGCASDGCYTARAAQLTAARKRGRRTMAQSNAERVGRALELLNEGLRPFLKREFLAVYGKDWLAKATDGLAPHQMPGMRDGDLSWDTQSLLLVMWD